MNKTQSEQTSQNTQQKKKQPLKAEEKKGTARAAPVRPLKTKRWKKNKGVTCTVAADLVRREPENADKERPFLRGDGEGSQPATLPWLAKDVTGGGVTNVPRTTQPRGKNPALPTEKEGEKPKTEPHSQTHPKSFERSKGGQREFECGLLRQAPL